MDPVLLAFLLERLSWAVGIGAVAYGFTQRNPWVLPLLQRGSAAAGRLLPGRQIQHKLDLVLSEQQQVRQQLYPNGGSSLFDLSKRNEATLGRIRRHLAIVEAQSNSMRDSGGMLAYSTNPDGEHVQSSRPLLALLGMEPGEATGLGWKNCIAPADLSEYVESWGSAVEDGRDFICEVRLRNVRSGQLIPVKVTADVVRVDGEVVGWMGRIERQKS
jgi:PAS domain-containing protein